MHSTRLRDITRPLRLYNRKVAKGVFSFISGLVVKNSEHTLRNSQKYLYKTFKILL